MRKTYVLLSLMLLINYKSTGQYLTSSGLTSTCGNANGQLHLTGSYALIDKWEEGTYSPGPNRVFTVTNTHSGPANPSLSYNVTAPGKKAFRAFYRLIQNGPIQVTEPIEISAVKEPKAGTAKASQTSFYMDGTVTLQLTGTTGTAQWKKRDPVGGGGWQDITLTNGTYHISKTTEFIANVSNGPCTGGPSSNIVLIEVYKPGVISGPPTSIEDENVTIGAGGANKVERWEYSIDGGSTWVNGPATAAFTHRITGNTKFRVLANLGPYGTEYSNVLTVVSIPYTQAHSNPTNGRNYVREQQIIVPGVTNPNTVGELGTDEKREVMSYLDGTGRTVQQNVRKGSPLEKDVISIFDFDRHGGQTARYLPYVSGISDGEYKSNALAEQAAFYNNGTSDKIADSHFPFSKIVVEKSPLGRILEEGRVGAQWQPGGGHTKIVNYSNNIANEVRLFKEDGSSTSFYDPNELIKMEYQDEDQNKKQVFTDKSGQTILTRTQLDEVINGSYTQWLETYYVYNKLGQNKFIISPKGVSALRSGSWSFTQTIEDQYVHQFVYDNFGRLVEKKVPGQGWVYYCYDRLDRLVLMQDAHIRSQNKWIFIKYDRRGRPVIQGLYSNTTHSTRAGIQLNLLDPLYATETSKYYEGRGAAGNGYTNQSFPTSDFEVLTVNYYDNYDFDYNGTVDFSYTSQGLAGEHEPLLNVNGIATGSKSKIPETNNWLYNYIFYNKEGNIIQIRNNNHLSLTIDNLTTVVYDFEGKTKLKKMYHNAGTGKVTTVLNRFDYDHMGRIKRIYQNNNNAAADQLIAQYNYNELGQLVDKQLHNTSGTDFLQSIDYRYNIQGWLTSINNASLSNDGINNDDTNDYFGLEFLYNTPEPGLLVSGEDHYNGSVSAVKWKGVGVTVGKEDQMSYKYSYDKAGRLRSGDFQKNDGSTWSRELGAFNEQMDYDLNGNILILQRFQSENELTDDNGLPVFSTAIQTIDNLTYNYDPAMGDRLLKVTDASNNKSGFDNGSSAGNNDYSYDANGNLKSDANKGVDDIAYNYLGKPTLIDFGDGRKIEYLYDAGGAKLSMKVFNANSSTPSFTKEYVNGFVYENDQLSYFSSPEGRIVNKDGNFEYQYAIADNQGNTRVLFSSINPSPSVVKATFEGDESDDLDQFQNINANNIVSSTAANHSSPGSKAIRMNQTYKLGPSKSIAVYPGDKVDLEVYSYYENSSGFGNTSTPLATMVGMVASGFGGVSGGEGQSGMIFDGISEALGTFGFGGNRGNDKPAAYLNYILFDKAYNLLDMGWQAAAGNAFTKELITLNNIEIKEAGYIFVYLSYDNTSNNWVYFDDLKITHTETNILQYNEYYPYGLQTNTSWTRKESSNNFLYNNANELNPETEWYETFFRNYDPAIGRFTGIDPLATKFASLSGYHYSYNNPVMFNDPMGAYPVQAQPEPGDPWFSGNWNWMMDMGPQNDYYDRGTGQWVIHPYNDYESYERLGMGHIYADQQRTANYISQVTASRNNRVRVIVNGQTRHVNSSDISIFSSSTYAGGETYYHYEMVLGEGISAQNGGDCPTCLDPSTVGNWFYNYGGPNNPKSYNGEYNYSVSPKNISDAQAYSHDLNYDEKRAVGGLDLVLNTSVIDADIRFVQNQFNVAGAYLSQFRPTAVGFMYVPNIDPYTNQPIGIGTASKALIQGVGLGIISLPKIIIWNVGTKGPF